MAATIAQVLKAVSPNADARFAAASANAGAIMAGYGIVSVNAQAQLIGHMAVECAGFRTFAENLNYSAERLRQVWPSRFPSAAAAQACAHNPKALALKVYAGRMGNRPGTEDPWDFRGSGGLQHTGRAEFERVARRTVLSVVEHPDMLRDAAAADTIWRAACSYFADRHALAAADAGDTHAVCVKVNGGTTGLSDRKIMVTRAAHALAGATLVIAEKTTHEQADAAKRTAREVTKATPAVLIGSTGGAKTADIDWGLSIGIGVAAFIALLIVAAVLWRRHDAKKGAVDALALQKIDERLSLPAPDPAPAAA